MKNKIIIFVVGIIAGILLLVFVKQINNQFGLYAPTNYKEYINFVEEQYDGEIDKDFLDEAIYAGITMGLEDPHSSYIFSKEVERFNQSLSTEFDGIGVSILSDPVGAIVEIVEVFNTSGAEDADLYAGDIIKKVNGVEVNKDNLESVVSMIKEKSTTDLEIYRPSSNETLMINNIQNRSYEMPSVTSKIIETSGAKYGYIDINSFSDTTGDEFVATLKDVESKSIKGLIIDTRGNGGGTLQSVSQILNSLVTKDKPYLITKKNGEVISTEYTTLTQKKPYPIVGLQNGSSASASEILMGALKEGNASQVVGSQSYGKGSVQSVYPIENTGGSAKITVSHWFTPDGNSIEGVGITPTIKLDNELIGEIKPIVLDSQINEGTVSQQAYQLNYYLSILGYQENTESSVFDAKSKQSLIKFQEDNGLKATGILDVVTADILLDKARENFHTYENDEYIRKAIDSIKK